MTGLTDHLLRRIALQGPLTVAEFMAEALGHPKYGYYATRDPLGAAGDFITAPEISQMFGELIGLWAAVAWQAMGSPDRLILAELGPGRGTLMADALRATRRVPGFHDAVSLHLIEMNPVLRTRQAEALADSGLAAPPAWHDDFGDLPDGPLLLFANEFFDALPIRQFQRDPAGWRERMVDADDAGTGLRLGLGPVQPDPPLLDSNLKDAPPGSVAEVCPLTRTLAHALGARLAREGGAALIVDYGYAPSQPGETLQAMRAHEFRDILDRPGETDLTAHVDFAALLRAGCEGGASGFGPLPQGTFLERLGLGARTEALLTTATSRQAEDIRAARDRLASPGGMGDLFKAAVLQHPDLPPPPGF